MPNSKSQDGASRYSPRLSLVVEIITTIVSGGTAGILGYFVYYLSMDHMHAPWEFIYLLTTSSITLLAFIAIFVKRIFFKSMQVRLRFFSSIVLYAILSAAWGVGLAAMTIRLRLMVLSHSCERTMWKTEDGIMVCQIYKALYAAIVVSTAGCFICFITEIVAVFANPNAGMNVFGGRSRGGYTEMKDDKTQQLQEFQSYQTYQNNGDRQPHGKESKFEPLRGAELSNPSATLKHRYDTNERSRRNSASSTATTSTLVPGHRRTRGSLSHISDNDHHADHGENENEDDVGAAMLKPSPHLGDYMEDTSYRRYD